jgi:antitoxin CcdA
LVASLRPRQRERWLAENRGAIAAYDDHVEKHGAFSDGVRTF